MSAINTFTQIFDRLHYHGIFSLTLSDYIWVIGAAVLLILGIKIAAKFLKAVLIGAAIVLLVLFILQLFS